MQRPEAITADLLAWFRAEGRDLPWRRTQNPYHIWISEIMLQQTQVATVIPYYERFLTLFPTVEALASAPEPQVLKAWEGLGYYSRARNMQKAAREVVSHHGGRMPGTFAALKALPGIGDYTAGAIASIAFGERVPAVDGNVLRVIARLALLTDDVTLPRTKKRVEALAAALLPASSPGELNEALMELGARVCVPGKPRCDQCPVAAHCAALAAGVTSELPVKAKKKKPKPVVLAVALVEREGRLLLVPRPSEGLWGGMWGFPAAESASVDEAGEALAAALASLGLEAEIGPAVATLAHTL
ncbi:MAG: A/G-specific adenine glycosylase, partial [Candidatus Sericytochromatia bacterium]